MTELTYTYEATIYEICFKMETESERSEWRVFTDSEYDAELYEHKEFWVRGITEFSCTPVPVKDDGQDIDNGIMLNLEKLCPCGKWVTFEQWRDNDHVCPYCNQPLAL